MLRRLQRVFISEHSRLGNTLNLVAPAHESKSVDRNKIATYNRRNREKILLDLSNMSKLTSYTFVSFLQILLQFFFQPSSNVFSNNARSTGLILGKSLVELNFQNGL